MSEVKRIHTLTNTFSGVAAEARVAAELVRNGLFVADPYWTDDEFDLLILQTVSQNVIPVAVQVKAIQFISNERPRLPIQGLKKKYVAANKALCLAIYRPDSDDIWFIDGAENIKRVHNEQVQRGYSKKLFNELDDASDVPIKISKKPDAAFDSEWKMPKDNAAWLPQRINRVAKTVNHSQDLVGLLSYVLSNNELPQVEDDADETNLSSPTSDTE